MELRQPIHFKLQTLVLNLVLQFFSFSVLLVFLQFFYPHGLLLPGLDEVIVIGFWETKILLLRVSEIKMQKSQFPVFLKNSRRFNGLILFFLGFCGCLPQIAFVNINLFLLRVGSVEPPVGFGLVHGHVLITIVIKDGLEQSIIHGRIELLIIISFQESEMNPLILFLCFFLAILCSADRLLMVQEIFRHGARYPVSSKPGDGSQNIASNGLIAELTDEGKMMHYELGRNIYSTYWKDLFGGSLEEGLMHKQIYVKSTGKNRTIQSAQYHILGLLETIQSLSIPEDLKQKALPTWKSEKKSADASISSGCRFHSLPIHVEEGGKNYLDSDFLTINNEKSCLMQKEWKEENLRSPFALRVRNHPKVQSAKLALESALNAKIEFKDVYRYKDSQVCFKYLGHPYLPVFDDPQHAQIYEFLLSFAIYLQQLYQPQQIRAETFNNFHMDHQNPRSPKLIIYSAHDSTIAMMLVALNMTSAECIAEHYLNGTENGDSCIYETPGFASSIILELWEREGVKIVKARYNGVHRKIPVCGNKDECPLSELQTWFHTFYMHDWKQKCGMKTLNEMMFVYLGLVMVALILLTQRCLPKQKKVWSEVQLEETEVLND